MLQIDCATVAYAGIDAVSDITIEVPDGAVLALLGPSGCGKSTLLRAIAGLEPLAGGSIRWDGTELAGVPVHRRGFGLMFQDGVLFPHRDVAGNIAYGLQRAGLGRQQIAARVAELLELVGLPGYGRRRVGTLSGGEAQRVALARALAPRPRLLLLDEPLAALDRSLRERLLTDLRAVLTTTGTTAVFVTHDQHEAFAVADLLAVMRSGTVLQCGPARAVWASPANDWVAGFVGYSSILDGVAANRLGLTGLGPDARIGLRPAALHTDPAGPLTGQVLLVTPVPEGSLLTVAVDGIGVLQAIGPADAYLAPGAQVRLRLDPAATAVIQPDLHQPPVPTPGPTPDPAGTLVR
ncbi:MAG: ABC transporter ATP-binding protein [Nakamurella sp.]